MKRRKSTRGQIRVDRKGGPLLEEGILIGIGLFAFLVLASIVTDIIQWLIGNFSQAGDTLGGLLGGNEESLFFYLVNLVAVLP